MTILLSSCYYTNTLNTGYNHFRLKEYDKALLLIEEAMAIKPNKSEPYYYRAWVYVDMQRNEEALQDFKRAIQLNPSKAEYYNGRGIIKSRLGEHENALTDFHRTLEIEPKASYPLTNIAGTYYVKKDYQNSLNYYNLAIENYSIDDGCDCNVNCLYLHRGRSLRHLGMYKEALADYEKSIEIDNRFCYGYFDIGWLNTILGDELKAKAAFQNSVDCGSLDSTSLAFAMFLLGKQSKAYELINEAFNSAEGDSAVIACGHYYMACAQAYSRQSEQAIESFEKALNFGFDDSTKVKYEPAFSFLKSDSTFVRLMKRM